MHIVAELVVRGRVKRRVTVSATGCTLEACRAMTDAGWRRAEGITGTYSVAWVRDGAAGECWLRPVDAEENHVALVESARLACLS